MDSGMAELSSDVCILRSAPFVPACVDQTADKEKVAAAILQWAQDMGASSYCHWFQVSRSGRPECS